MSHCPHSAKTRPTSISQHRRVGPWLGRCVERRRTHRIACRAASEQALVVVGSVNADLVLEVSRLPFAGETVSASTCATFAGGKVCLTPAPIPFQSSLRCADKVG